MTRRRLSRLAGSLSFAGLVFFSGCDNPPSPSAKYFLKYYGEEGFQTCVDMEIDAAGNYYLLGTSGSGVGDKTASLFIVKLDPSGDVIFKQSIPPESANVLGFEARDIELESGGFVVLANAYKASDNRDFFVGRYGADGSFLDTAVIAPVNITNKQSVVDDEANSITIIDNGNGYIIAGASSGLTPTTGDGNPRDGVHVRLDKALNQANVNDWQPATANGSYDYETKVIQIRDTLFYSFGYANGIPGSDGTFDFTAGYIGKSGRYVSILDISKFLQRPASDERLGSMVIGLDGRFYLAGITSDRGAVASSRIYLGVLSQTGTDADPIEPISVTAQPDFELKTAGSSTASIAYSASGGLLVLTTENTAGNDNLLLMKFNKDGSKIWTSPIAFGGLENDFAGAVKELPDGRIMICGTMSINGETKMVLMKLNNNGHLAD